MKKLCPDPESGSPANKDKASRAVFADTLPPELAAVVTAWPRLPQVVQAGILVMVKAVQ